MSSLSEAERPNPDHLALVEISSEDNKITIAQVSHDGDKEESSFDDSTTASRFLVGVLQRSADMIHIDGHVHIEKLFQDIRRARTAVAVRVLIVDPKTIEQELPHIAAMLKCFRFDELAVRGKHDYGCSWKVPPVFVLQSPENVYNDLAGIQRTRCVIPREFFSIPSVKRLDYIHICPNPNKWMRRRPPKYFLALMDFIFEPPPEMDSPRMEPVIAIGHDCGISARFVDDIVEKFCGFAGDERMLPFTLHYGGSLNKVWRSAAENAVKLLTKNAALRGRDILYDSYTFRNVTVGKILRVDVCYPDDDYPQRVCMVRFRMLDDAENDGANETCEHKETDAKRHVLPVEQLEEVLRFLERFDIEVCQLSCRLFNGIVVPRAQSLPVHSVGITFDSSSYKDGELVTDDIVANLEKPDWHEHNDRRVTVHPSLPNTHYIDCQFLSDLPNTCKVMKATVGAEVTLMRCADPYVCSRRLAPTYNFVPRFIRNTNAIAQDDAEAVEALLRLTANSLLFGVVFAWLGEQGFVATDAFIDAWRRALGIGAERPARLRIHRLRFSYWNIAALTPSNFVRFFCDEADVLDVAITASAEAFDTFLGSDDKIRDRWKLQ